jgi:hypothetical protein
MKTGKIIQLVWMPFFITMLAFVALDKFVRLCKYSVMKNIVDNSTSAFALMVDKLRTRGEEEIKLLQTKFFSSEFIDEWASITSSSNVENISEKDIVKAIVQKRLL